MMTMLVAELLGTPEKVEYLMWSTPSKEKSVDADNKMK
jgi:hypothetical protein